MRPGQCLDQVVASCLEFGAAIEEALVADCFGELGLIAVSSAGLAHRSLAQHSSLAQLFEA